MHVPSSSRGRVSDVWAPAYHRVLGRTRAMKISTMKNVFPSLNPTYKVNVPYAPHGDAPDK